MELIKLIGFLVFSIIIRQCSFLFIVLSLWLVNLIVGLYLNRTYFERKQTYLSTIIYNIITIFEWMFRKVYDFFCYIMSTSIGIRANGYVEEVDKVYLDGRNHLTNLIKKMLLKI